MYNCHTLFLRAFSAPGGETALFTLDFSPRGEEATPVEHQKEHKIGDFARKYGDYM